MTAPDPLVQFASSDRHHAQSPRVFVSPWVAELECCCAGRLRAEGYDCEQTLQGTSHTHPCCPCSSFWLRGAGGAAVARLVWPSDLDRPTDRCYALSSNSLEHLRYIQIQPADYQGPDGMKIPDGPIEHEHISRIMENLDQYGHSSIERRRGLFDGRFGPLRNRPLVVWRLFLDSGWTERTAKKRGKKRPKWARHSHLKECGSPTYS